MERLFLPFVTLVKLIITHFRPHLDELGAWWLALRFGESIFPGISKAVLQLWNAGNKTPDGRTPRQWKEQSGALLLGVGGAKTASNPDGAEFDEHGSGGDETTLILMAKALGLTTEPALRSLLKYVQANDRKGNATPWDLASILKAINGHTLNTVQVAEFVFERLDANYNRELKNDPSWRSSVHADLFDMNLAAWLWDSFAGKAKDTAERPATAAGVIEFLRIGGREDISEIVKLALRDHSKGAAGPFDIVTMFSEMVDNGGDAAAQLDFVYIIMNAKFAQQRRFVDAVTEVRTNGQITWIGDAKKIAEMKKPRVVRNAETEAAIKELCASGPSDAEKKDPTIAAKISGMIAETIKGLEESLIKPSVIAPNAVILTDGLDGIRPVQVISTVSDNEEVIKVMRVLHPDAQFYIRRQSSKHTVINGPKQLMDSVCAETRMAENFRRNGSGGTPIPREHLRMAGNIPEDRVWSYHREGGQMLNGSLTSPGAPHTLQTLEGLWKVIARALRHSARFDRRVRLAGAPPPSRSSKKPHPTSAPTAPKAPQATGNGRDRNRGHQRDRNRNRGRRPEASPATRTVVASGSFGHKPFAALRPDEFVPPSGLTTPATPVPAPAESVVPVPVADATPVSTTEAPSTEHLAMPEPAAPPAAPAPKAARKPRVARKAAAPKSGKKAPKKA